MTGAAASHPRKRTPTSEHGHARDLNYPPLPEPLGVATYDNHTHLEIEDGEVGLSVAEHLARAADAGIAGAITVGGDVPSSRWSVEAAATDARLYAAVAIHPNEAPRIAAAGGAAALDAAIAEIEALARHPRVKAIGETGLDAFRTEGDEAIAWQHRAFERHIDLAKRLSLPMQIHDRDAHDDVIATLRREGAPPVTVFHCFSGDADMARIAADEGWYLSFAGNVTFKNAQNLRDALAVARRDRILVETDAPFLTPVPLRGRPNAPYLVPHTVRFMAGQLGLDADELAAQLTENTVRAYGAWSAEGVGVAVPGTA
ncbi:AraC family transcriptional regulator [Pseudoclavibacter endophyticus]|uniref:TatD family deoxyribonuclease n=1 Tax=Pseudoclavibacter endophyticus TaxID=1778590 RepID=A0A6H9WF60_9MICO|nr:TatD family hydrolase [Pseudoclavibacter endophyticus]KAB1649579.1 TatD family deoxyribonuclease [Pseudoclavibacter endophyticus]GGA61482.1 AraC family transcriptional regulator [Pseudoclavibacter endophyticus]